MRKPEATIIIPTHSATWTLENAIESAINQEVKDIEILIVGDGVQPETRSTINTFTSENDKVVFLDLLKAPHRGEMNRDIGVRRASSEFIFYLADDDLLLPNHLTNLLPLLETKDLVQSLNTYVDFKGNLRFYPTDLGNREYVNWHLQDPPRNCVSITGTGHRKSTYLSLSSGWEVPSLNIWPDLHLWRKFFSLSDFRGATHFKVSAIQFPSLARKNISENQFKDIYLTWLNLVQAKNYEVLIEEEVKSALLSELILLHYRRF